MNNAKHVKLTGPFMPKHFLAMLLVVASLASAGTADVAFARDPHRAGRHGGDTGTGLNAAVQQVQRETGGRVLSADTVNQGGRSMHRIKVLLPSGQVRVVTVGAQSGSR